jgi:hypothetical protein
MRAHGKVITPPYAGSLGIDREETGSILTDRSKVESYSRTQVHEYKSLPAHFSIIPLHW